MSADATLGIQLLSLAGYKGGPFVSGTKHTVLQLGQPVEPRKSLNEASFSALRPASSSLHQQHALWPCTCAR